MGRFDLSPNKTVGGHSRNRVWGSFWWGEGFQADFRRRMGLESVRFKLAARQSLPASWLSLGHLCQEVAHPSIYVFIHKHMSAELPRHGKLCAWLWGGSDEKAPLGAHSLTQTWPTLLSIVQSLIPGPGQFRLANALSTSVCSWLHSTLIKQGVGSISPRKAEVLQEGVYRLGMFLAARNRKHCLK